MTNRSIENRRGGRGHHNTPALDRPAVRGKVGEYPQITEVFNEESGRWEPADSSSEGGAQ